MTITSPAPLSESSTTLYSVWQILAEQHGDLMALRDPHAQPVLEITYAQLFTQIQWFAGGLQALGVKPADKVAIIADNSPYWLVADLATLFAGTVNVPRSATADAQEIDYIIRNTQCTTVIVENLKTYRRIHATLEQAGIPRVILLSDETADALINFPQLLEKGRAHGFEAPSIERSDLATIIHTSGTSGQPKGVMLTHGNLMHQVEYCEVVVQPKPGYRVLAILPTWHSYERSCEYFLLSRACTLIYTQPRHLKQDLRQEKPHFLIAVPRIWETLYDGIQKNLQEQSPFMQKLVTQLLGISEAFVLARRIATGQSIQHLEANPSQRLLAQLQMLTLYPLHQIANRLIYRKIRQALGANFQHAISGGGSLPAYLDLFYEIVGISILNGYGLTETSPILAARRPDNNVRGTVGPPLPKTQFKIVHLETADPLPQGEKGVILARGPQVMQGYYNNPTATAKVLSEDGWFNTGDLGWLTPDGQLVITGRAKDTIVLINGENIEPQPLEDVCLQSPYLQQLVVVGQDQKKLAALIYPNLDALKAWAESEQLSFAQSESELLASAQVRSLLLTDLQQRIRQRPGYRPDDQISDFRFVPEPFSIDNGLMTQTLKIKRLQVNERYQDLIQQIYA
ncbi:MAG: AMP-binding protein [Cyanobacteriota bacterium]|nr:AMP-binding protein [Cyanobacteriota bacterium]